MRLVNSVCSGMMFPESRKSIDAFRRVADFLRERGMDCMEFYYDGPASDRFGDALAANGLDAVYVAVIPSKERKLWLCDLDEGARRKAIDMHKRCVDHALDNGITRVMICSGVLQDDIPRQLDALAGSVGELFEYAADKNPEARLLLEPCDDAMQACNLLGPCARVRDFTLRVNEAGIPMELTMDCAHSSEMGEDFAGAVRAVRPWCRHVHFANCDISRPESPFYGDKHVGFEYPDTEWPPSALGVLFRQLEALYPGDAELRIGVEILCREDDPFAYFDKTWSMLPFLHKENRK